MSYSINVHVDIEVGFIYNNSHSRVKQFGILKAVFYLYFGSFSWIKKYCWFSYSYLQTKRLSLKYFSPVFSPQSDLMFVIVISWYQAAARRSQVIRKSVVQQRDHLYCYWGQNRGERDTGQTSNYVKILTKSAIINIFIKIYRYFPTFLNKKSIF